MSRWDEKRSPESVAKEVDKAAARGSKLNAMTGSIRTYRPGAAEELITLASRSRGRISPSAPLPLMTWVGAAIGLRDGDDDWLTAKALDAMAFARDKDGRVVLSRTTPKGNLQEFVFDPAHDHALVCYRLLAKDSAALITEVTAGDFRLVDRVEVPFTMTSRMINIKLNHVILQWEAHVTRCEVSGQANTEDHYRIAWPVGVEIVDLRREPPARIKVQHDGEKAPD
jgi:hypothetical protein